MVFVEIFAGSASLSSAVEQNGFVVVPFDYHANKHRLRRACHAADLLSSHGQSIAWEAITDVNTFYVHLAPPCGTASRARETPQGASAPRPLRSASYPQGVPGLNDIESRRVAAANQLYSFTADVVDYSCRMVFSCRLKTRPAHGCGNCQA
eukprot:5063137-Amphidinium_carterae.2